MEALSYVLVSSTFGDLSIGWGETEGAPRVYRVLLPKENEQALVQDVDPAQPVYGLTTLADMVAGTLDGDRFFMLLLIVFATAAAILATVGIYGVISYTVSQRTREIGIRMALGAGRDSVFGLVLRQGMAPVFVGIGTGILVALISNRLLADIVFGVGTADPVSFAIITLLVTGIALLSVSVPARRAVRIHPTEALRHE